MIRAASPSPSATALTSPRRSIKVQVLVMQKRTDFEVKVFTTVKIFTLGTRFPGRAGGFFVSFCIILQQQTSEANQMQTKCKQHLPLFCVGFISFARKNKKK